jgi:hypothetical protein
VEKAVDDVMELVEAVAAGPARQRLWYARRRSEPIGAEAWVQVQDGGRWVRFQRWAMYEGFSAVGTGRRRPATPPTTEAWD